MKKITLVLITFILLIACQKELVKIEANVITEKQETSKEDYLSIISSLGYSIDDIKENETSFLISNSIVLDKNVLDSIANNPLTKAITLKDRLPESKQHFRLVIYQTDYRYMSIFDDAVRTWNSMQDCNIVFLNPAYDDYPNMNTDFAMVNIYINENPIESFNSNIDYRFSFLQVHPIYSQGDVVGGISINTSSQMWEMLPDDQRKKAIIHSLGLLIGLSPSNDFNSIMRSVAYINSSNYSSFWPDFDNYHNDIYEIECQYPVIPDDIYFKNQSVNYYAGSDYHMEIGYDAVKPIPNATYECSVIESVDGINPIISVSGNIVNLSFPKTGLYRIKVKVNGPGNTVRGMFEESFNVVNGIICPTEVTINQPFTIGWIASGENSSVAEINFSFIKEKYFDNTDSQNIIIAKKNVNTASITIKDTGHYIVEASLKNRPSEKKYFNIEVYARPSYELSDPLELGDQMVPAIETITSNLELGTSITKMPYSLTIGNSETLDNRLVYYLKENYICNTDQTSNTRRIDHRLVYLNETKRTVPAGGTNVIQLPHLSQYVKSFDQLNPATGEIQNYTMYSAGYYTLRWPDNKCEVTNTL